VGTGPRGTYNWGKPVIEDYKDFVEMVALRDINPKRMAASKAIPGINAKCYYTSSVQVNYDNGTQMSYTMNTFLPIDFLRL